MTTVLERPTTATDGPVVDKRVVRRRLGPGKRIPFSLAIGPILLVGLWCLLSWTGRLDPRTLSEPWVVVQTARDLIESGRLQDALKTSAVRAFAGLGIGTVAGCLLALVSGLSRTGEAVIDGPVQIKRAIPTLALIPLLVIWFGIGEAMKVTVISLAVFIPIYLNTHTGCAASRPATPNWPRPSTSADRLRPPRGPARRAPWLHAGPAVRGDGRLAGPRRRRTAQRHQRHRLHDQSRPHLRPDRRHRRGHRGLRPAGSGLGRRSRPSSGMRGLAQDPGQLTHPPPSGSATSRAASRSRASSTASTWTSAGRVRGAARPQRLRQVHPAARARRPRPRGRRARRHRRAAPDRRRLPGRPAAALEAGARQRRPRPRAAPTPASAAARPWPRSGWPAANAPGRTNSPAASSSGWRWPAPWSATRSCCWPTSRSARSTR